MAGTKTGGLQAAKTNIDKYGSDFYKRIGSVGGRVQTEKTRNKGFASNRDLARKVGAIGGRISRRYPKKGE